MTKPWHEMAATGRALRVFLAAGILVCLSGTAMRAAETPKPADARSFIERFNKIDPGTWYVFDNFAYGDALNDTAWSKGNAVLVDPSLELKLATVAAFGKANTGAQLNTTRNFGYGRYEAVMQPARGSGTVSAFFTYTGPYFGDPQDEIDFEFLGKDTTKVQLNYFVHGKGGHEKLVDLGFDGADAMHTYAIEWAAGSIRWYIDGKLVHAVTGDATTLPAKPGKIYLELWAGGAPALAWLGPTKYESPIFARYQCVSFVPEGGAGPQCSDRAP